MINNICENNNAAKINTASKEPILTAVKADSRYYEDDKTNYVATANKDNNNSRGGSVVQTTYEHGIWYSEIIDSANNANNNKIVHKKQYCTNATSNNSNTENIANTNVWLSAGSCDAVKEQQQQQTHCIHTNNECDIVVVDIEDDDIDNNDVERQQQQEYCQQKPTYSTPSAFFINTDMKFFQKDSTIYGSQRVVAKNSNTCSVNSNTHHMAKQGHINNVDNIGSSEEAEEDDKDDEDDSLASMETISDNISIWVDGEKHWVAGVDANTTCSELIWALLNYQNGQQISQRELQQQKQHQHDFSVAPTIAMTAANEKNIASTNSNQYERYELQNQQRQQQAPKSYKKNVTNFNLKMTTGEVGSNLYTASKPNIQNAANTDKTPTNTTNPTTIITTINQSMPINAKENCKIIQNSTLATTEAASTASAIAAAIASSLSPTPGSEVIPPTLLPITLPPGIATVSQIATEFVIVKQYHHCEEYLDGTTKVLDVLPPRDGSNRKECELLLRHLGPAPAVYINNTTPQLSSLISTDKDSGMGSPVGSARSAKFRRRKHKSSQWLAQANTLHPKLSHCSANERLMKIILAQDETIQKQLSLLREKERQITKIEEEKHRKRERELGKNYLLETYLNGLDEAECEPEIQDGEEIFIDEPYPTAPISTSASTFAAADVTSKQIPSTTEPLNIMAKHKLKDKKVKKEKKKKRHKGKQTRDEDIHVKDFNLKTNNNNVKEKVAIPQKHHHELNALEQNIKDNSNEQEIKLQVFWLEKIYILNKQLQKEEELAAKLHAKVRKHQLRNTQHTQQEVQMEIDKLDNNLALQHGDIRKVEANLMQTNEQLQKRLLILERLSVEYLQEQQENELNSKQDDLKALKEKQSVKEYITKDTENPLKNDASTLLTSLEKSLDIKKLSLNNIKSQEEVIKLEKIIAKPTIDLRPVPAELKETKQVVNTIAENVASIRTASSHNNPRLPNVATVATNHNATHNNQQQQQEPYPHHHHHHQELLATPSAIALSAAGRTSHNTETISGDTSSTSCVIIDKNMLSSLHVQNAKTIKKQMFHTQTTAALAAATSASTTSSQLLSPPLTQLPLITSGFPKRQFQHTTQQHMPTASTFLTSGPQNLHQIQVTNSGIEQQPITVSYYCSSLLAPTSTSSPLVSARATTIAQRPPISTSPSPSIMAMNTVDISQLGTLV